MKIILITIFTLFLANTMNAQHNTNYFFSQDKMLHFGAGYMGSAIVTATADRLGAKNPQAWGILATSIAAVGKEYYDYKTNTGTVEGFDMWATMMGGVLGAATISITIDTRKKRNYKEEKKIL
jgi:hypothetical protein